MKKLVGNSLDYIGLQTDNQLNWNTPAPELISRTMDAKQGFLTDTGALVCDTGRFTGRSPKDKFIVMDDLTEESVWWGDVNQPFKASAFEGLYQKMIAYLSLKEIYVQDVYACAAITYRLKIRAVTEYAWQALFVHNLFIKPEPKELAEFKEDWLILSAPGFFADPATDETRSANFTVINFSRKIILIGGTAYTGEIKKSVFTVLNFLLPRRQVLPMHCSANTSAQGDTALFFGLSGTGKTTLSADPARKLVGDDEHGWDDTQIFNIEGGCYAKCANLSQEKEPQIFNAIQYGALLENTCFHPGTRRVNYEDISETENTRAAYPLDFMDNIQAPAVATIPRNIFFLSADAFGVLPPISKLTQEQAMYHFLSGYTAKVAGTEMGVTELGTTFSACFGKSFLPLHPMHYALLLGEKLRKAPIQVWLINTGWTGGSYGTGTRIPLEYTRAMITAALNGNLQRVSFTSDAFFGLQMPDSCRGVPSAILNPQNTWKDPFQYRIAAAKLVQQFIQNFSQYMDLAMPEIWKGGPIVEKSI